MCPKHEMTLPQESSFSHLSMQSPKHFFPSWPSTPAVLFFEHHSWAGFHCTVSLFEQCWSPRAPTVVTPHLTEAKAFTCWGLCLISEASMAALHMQQEPHCSVATWYLFIQSCTDQVQLMIPALKNKYINC